MLATGRLPRPAWGAHWHYAGETAREKAPSLHPKIQPQVGPAYCLIDSNGDGTLNQRSSIPMDININQ
jgi:hypothetical protein